VIDLEGDHIVGAWTPSHGTWSPVVASSASPPRALAWAAPSWPPSGRWSSAQPVRWAAVQGFGRPPQLAAMLPYVITKSWGW